LWTLVLGLRRSFGSCRIGIRDGGGSFGGIGGLGGLGGLDGLEG